MRSAGLLAFVFGLTVCVAAQNLLWALMGVLLILIGLSSLLESEGW